MHRTLHRLHRNLTRNGLERALGGEWVPDEDDPTRRVNGKYVTFKGYGKGRRGLSCCIQGTIHGIPLGRVTAARSWGALARAMGVVK